MSNGPELPRWTKTALPGLPEGPNLLSLPCQACHMARNRVSIILFPALPDCPKPGPHDSFQMQVCWARHALRRVKLHPLTKRSTGSYFLQRAACRSSASAPVSTQLARAPPPELCQRTCLCTALPAHLHRSSASAPASTQLCPRTFAGALPVHLPLRSSARAPPPELCQRTCLYAALLAHLHRSSASAPVSTQLCPRTSTEALPDDRNGGRHSDTLVTKF